MAFLEIRTNSIYIYIYIQVSSNSLAIDPHLNLSHATYVKTPKSKSFSFLISKLIKTFLLLVHQNVFVRFQVTSKLFKDFE